MESLLLSDIEAELSRTKSIDFRVLFFLQYHLHKPICSVKHGKITSILETKSIQGETAKRINLCYPCSKWTVVVPRLLNRFLKHHIDLFHRVLTNKIIRSKRRNKTWTHFDIKNKNCYDREL